MDRALALVEKVILYVLMGLMAIVLILATLDLIWTIGVAVPRHRPDCSRLRRSLRYSECSCLYWWALSS